MFIDENHNIGVVSPHDNKYDFKFLLKKIYFGLC